MRTNMPITSSIFAVLDEPYVLWGVDLDERSHKFLEGIDADYFHYVYDLNIDHVDDDENGLRAALSIRLAFYQALETFFSLVGALLQAPTCSYAWINKYKTDELRKLVSSIDAQAALEFIAIDLPEYSWRGVASIVMQQSHQEPANLAHSIEQFAKTWPLLAYEFLNKDNSDERNHLLHGFRIRAGGSYVRFGFEHKFGIPPPESEMKSLGGSKYGSSAFVLERIDPKDKANRSYVSKRTNLNWSIERTVLALQLLGMSIQNVVSCLRILNGAQPQTAKFMHPLIGEDLAGVFRQGLRPLASTL
jgi:GNAT superfamily N-acetyltransferase